MSARRHYLTLVEAAAIAYTKWDKRDPEIDDARALEAREDARRERDYTNDDPEDES